MVSDTETDVNANSIRTCHRRSCDERATFVVLERYQEETGQGSVEARVVMCQDHAAEEHPVNLDADDPDYVFHVEPLSAADDESE